MSKVSVIIPCREEPYLFQTVRDLLSGAAGEIEIVVVVDGPQEYKLPKDKRVKVIQFDQPQGRRAVTNAAVQASTGEWLLKIDAHCMIKEGYDETLKADCADNWIMVPSRFGLDVENWRTISQPVEEAMYYLYPYKRPHWPKFTCRPWPERASDRSHILIDEDMGFQGSMYFMSRAHWDRLGGMNENGYGSFVSEPEELGLKTQLGPWDGKVVRNKKLWYAHWAKAQSHWYGRGKGMMGWITETEWWDGWRYTADFWMKNRWSGRAHDIEWLIDRFWPVPGWPDDWKAHRFKVQS